MDTRANVIIFFKASRGVEVAVTLAASQLPRLSLVSAAMGLFHLTCILIRRVIVLETFAEYAYDKYWETFLCFAITSRLPLLCLCISMVSLGFRLVPVAFAAYPYEMIALFVSCGVSVALHEINYIFMGIDMSIRGVRWAVRVMSMGFRAVYGRFR
ncbi:hypothetical protein PENSPDRAFT_264496 [Peniophora sp. CONT]|nr:hypothetical protein PENSPDRAFT_264496 [Peniophora sp. CONT]